MARTERDKFRRAARMGTTPGSRGPCPCHLVLLGLILADRTLRGNKECGTLSATAVLLGCQAPLPTIGENPQVVSEVQNL
jgi:hypothetical protein